MKIQELLLTTITSLNETLPADSTSLVINWDNLFNIQEHLSLDFQITLTELQYHISCTSHLDATPENLQCFKDFLAKRWELLRKTDFSYPHNPGTSPNTTCWLLANDIASTFSQSAYSLLMPSVEVQVNELTSNDWKDLQLQEFVLNDDETRFIEIADCLEFAEEDGIPKYTSLFPLIHEQGLERGVKRLSATEINRVVNHSAESLAYANAISNLLEIKNRGMTLGSYIKRLINQMLDGGVHALNNPDHNAEVGPASIHGIIEFDNFLQTLQREEKDLIYNSIAPGLTMGRNFKIIWLRLLSRAAIQGNIPLSEEYLNSIITTLAEENFQDQPCIELLAINLQQILQNNLNLYTVTPSQPEACVSLAEIIFNDYTQTLASTKNALKLSTQNLVFQPKNLYSTVGELKFTERMVKIITSHFSKDEILRSLPNAYTEAFLKNLDAVHLGLVIQNINDFMIILDKLTGVNKLFLLKSLESTNLKNIIKNDIELKRVLEKLSTEESKELLDNCTPEHLSTIFNHMINLSNTLETLHPDHHKLLLDKLGKDALSRIVKYDDIVNLLKIIPDIKYLLDLIGIEHAKKISEEVFPLSYLLASLALKDQKILIDFLGSEHLCKVLNNVVALNIIMPSLNNDLHLHFIENILSREYFSNILSNNYDLTNVLMSLKKRNRGKLLEIIGQEHFSKMTTSWNRLSIVLALISPTAQMNVICHLLQKNTLEIILDADAMRLALKGTNERFQFMYFSSPEHIARTIETLEDLFNVLKALSTEQQEEFIVEILEDVSLRHLIKNNYGLISLISNFLQPNINKILHRLEGDFLWSLIASVENLVHVLKVFNPSERQLFLENKSDSKNVCRVVNSYSALVNVLSQVDPLSQKAMLHLIGQPMINESIVANNGFVKLLEILDESIHSSYLLMLDDKQMASVLIGQQQFYDALKKFDDLQANPKVYAGVLILMARAYAEHIAGGNGLNSVKVLDQIAARSLAGVVAGIRPKSLLDSYQVQLLGGNLSFLYTRYQRWVFNQQLAVDKLAADNAAVRAGRGMRLFAPRPVAVADIDVPNVVPIPAIRFPLRLR